MGEVEGWWTFFSRCGRKFQDGERLGWEGPICATRARADMPAAMENDAQQTRTGAKQQHQEHQMHQMHGSVKNDAICQQLNSLSTSPRRGCHRWQWLTCAKRIPSRAGRPVAKKRARFWQERQQSVPQAGRMQTSRCRGCLAGDSWAPASRSGVASRGAETHVCVGVCESRRRCQTLEEQVHHPTRPYCYPYCCFPGRVAPQPYDGTGEPHRQGKGALQGTDWWHVGKKQRAELGSGQALKSKS